MKKIFLNILKYHKKISKNLVVIHEKKELLTLNKPLYLGCTV